MLALLSAVLNEMDLLQGEYIVPNEAIAYCPQTPWLQDISIRDNILFGLPLEESRYQEILSACELLPDMADLKDADFSLLGEKYGQSSKL
jgi:ABC-type multidrug transport system fused ATPase/permease subunit